MGKFLDGLYEELSLYVRQVAWLQATPRMEGAEALAAKGSRKVSRLEQLRVDMNDKEYWPEMPNCDVPYLMGHLFEVGPLVASPMGAGPISEQELVAWQANIGIELQPWECRFLKALSKEYLHEANEAVRADRTPPWKAPEALDRAAVAKRIKNLLRG